MKNSKLKVRIFELSFLVLANVLFNTGCVTYNKARLDSGSLDFLKHQSVVNVAFNYDGLRVGQINRKSVPEQEYIDKRASESGANSQGSDQNFRQEWIGNRTSKYQPKFLALLNKQFEERKPSLDFGTYPEATYTMVMKSTYLDPGWNAGIVMRPALLSADVTFVKTQNPSNPLAKISLINMQGMDPMGLAFDQSWRIQESYAMGGKRLGALIRKKIR